MHDDRTASSHPRRPRRASSATRGRSTTDSAAASGPHIQNGICAGVPSGSRMTTTSAPSSLWRRINLDLAARTWVERVADLRSLRLAAGTMSLFRVGEGWETQLGHN